MPRPVGVVGSGHEWGIAQRRLSNKSEDMGPTTQQTRPATDDNRQQQGFEHRAAPSLHAGLDLATATFSPQLEPFRLLFKLAPDIGTGMSVSNGENLPNRMNVFFLSALEGVRDFMTRRGGDRRAA